MLNQLWAFLLYPTNCLLFWAFQLGIFLAQSTFRSIIKYKGTEPKRTGPEMDLEELVPIKNSTSLFGNVCAIKYHQASTCLRGLIFRLPK